ncbi:MAG: hypothetical protein M9918_20925 [Anaerolineae bacterium]|nr:hypothetical protein [Anaerolineae bacterium]MCO5192062.1 hypothetical protein [Anaerolineae bacterium]
MNKKNRYQIESDVVGAAKRLRRTDGNIIATNWLLQLLRAAKSTMINNGLDLCCRQTQTMFTNMLPHTDWLHYALRW